jgi:hypothetical protein
MKRFNDPTKLTGFVVLVIAALATALVLATVNRKPKEPLVVSLVEDESWSTLPAKPCLKHSVNAALAQSSDQIEIRYFQTGNAATAYEPVDPVEPLRINKNDIAWSAGPAKVQTLAEDFLSKITASAPKKRTEKSPLFLTVQRAVADIRTNSAPARRFVIISCDLEDTTVPELVSAFKHLPGTKLKGLPQIDNEGVSVRFVSIQNTVGELEGSNRKFTAPRDPDRIKRLQEVWRSCFTNPELVSFSPTCNDPLP